MQHTRLLIAAFLASLVPAGAAGTDRPPPNRELEVRWVAPDLRPAPFDKVMLEPFRVGFRDVPPLTGPPGLSGTRGDFPVAPEKQQRVAAEFDSIFREELGKSRHFTLVEKGGPRVLLLRPALRDVVSHVPPEEPPGRSRVWVDTVGEATLVVEFMDPVREVTLGSATDRRTAGPFAVADDFGAVRATPVGTDPEIRWLARRWATALERRVEQLYFAAKPR